MQRDPYLSYFIYVDHKRELKLLEDEKILDLYWARDDRAITETGCKYGKYCRSIAYNLLSNMEDAKECENDTYAALWSTIPPSRPKRFKAYIGRVVRNISIDRYDYNTAGKRDCNMTSILSELTECIISKDDVWEQYEQGEIARQISAFLRTLDKPARQVFLRRYWYSEPISVIANEFHMSESKVKSMLFRIRNKLRLYLEKEGVHV